jgi:hypothetical protein
MAFDARGVTIVFGGEPILVLNDQHWEWAGPGPVVRSNRTISSCPATGRSSRHGRQRWAVPTPGVGNEPLVDGGPTKLGHRVGPRINRLRFRIVCLPRRFSLRRSGKRNGDTRYSNLRHGHDTDTDGYGGRHRLINPPNAF